MKDVAMLFGVKPSEWVHDPLTLKRMLKTSLRCGDTLLQAVRYELQATEKTAVRLRMKKGQVNGYVAFEVAWLIWAERWLTI